MKNIKAVEPTNAKVTKNENLENQHFSDMVNDLISTKFNKKPGEISKQRKPKADKGV